ncbi:MAG: aminotransferase class V-fold PLP-dependent enzyme [Candidatus Eremiobacteraeota bacterium]|nr:aminotransferase class V-fold PLP-dependent enzyme [Candidatus Eremiobacteraeota bacterium]
MAHQRNDWDDLSETPLPRELFEITKNYVYLNHAAVGVLPKPTREALHEFVDGHAIGGVMGVLQYELNVPKYRERIGRFIGASGAEIALLRNTSDGANAIAGGFRWKAGDEVILPDDEFPANAQPWLALRSRGVNVRFVERARSRLTPEVLRAMLTPRTKIVAVSWVGFSDGYRSDLAGLAEVAHANGTLLCVDAIQGLGAFPIDVGACGIDALYGAGAKWMLALQGVGFLYVRANLLDRLDVAAPGWRSVADMWNFLDYDQPPAPNASRFEGGTPNFIGGLSLARSIELFESSGTEAIAAHVLALTDRLVDGLQSAGAEVASERGRTCSSGIVTFSVPGRDPVEVGRAMQREGIVTTYRANGIRVAPHGYNSFDEIDRLLAAVREVP